MNKPVERPAAGPAYRTPGIGELREVQAFISSESSLHSMAATASIEQLLTNWESALKDGVPIERLLEDVDEVHRRMRQFKWAVEQMSGTRGVDSKTALERLGGLLTTRSDDPEIAQASLPRPGGR